MLTAEKHSTISDNRNVADLQASLSPAMVRTFAARFTEWQRRGLSARAAGAVALAACDSIEDVSRLGRSYFAKLPNCAEGTLNELGRLVDWAPGRKEAVDAIARTIGMAISDPDEIRAVAQDIMVSLKLAGFRIKPRGPSPTHKSSTKGS